MRDAICQPVPPPSADFWRSNAVWVGCTDINDASTSRQDSEVRNLAIKIRVVGKEGGPNVWDYFLSKGSALQDLIDACADGQRIVISDIQILKGSVEIFLIIVIVKGAATAATAAKATVGIASLISLIFGALTNYDRIKAGFSHACADCKSFVEKLLSGLRNFFSGIGRAADSSTS